MKFQRLLLVAASPMVAEAGLWSSLMGSGTTRLGLEASAGFLRSSRKAATRPSAAEVASALAAQDSADDVVVLMQQEAVAIAGGLPKQVGGPARVEADLLAATKKLEEPPVEPLDSSFWSRGVSAGNDSAPFQRDSAVPKREEVESTQGGSKKVATERALDPAAFEQVSAAQKWEDIKSAQDEAKRAAAEGAELLKDESVRHLMSWEAMLISNVATGEDERAQPCIAHCRYGEEVRHSWQECVERCVEDGLTKRMLLVGLPESERAAAHLDAPAPAGMEALKRKKAERRRARSEDL